MNKKQLKKNTEVWCWWKSEHLYFTGIVVNGKYVFEDICDEVTIVSESELKELVIR